MSANSNTKAMEDALQAAVARMNRPEVAAAPSAPTMDPIGLLAAVLPKFLENRGERDAVLERIDNLQSDDLAPLREEVRQARQQIHRLRKTQAEMMSILHQLSEQQTAIGDAVLHLAKQMARIEFVETVPDDADIYENVRHPAQAAAAPRRPPPQASKAGHRVKKNQP